MMEFTTPASYGNTIVNVSALAKDDEIISAGALSSAKHTAVHKDSENDWPEPETVSFEWKGQTRDGRPVVADVTGSLGQRLDRVDVLAHIPGFVKTIVGGVVGTKPYIYQVGELSLILETYSHSVVLPDGPTKAQGQNRRHRS
jgi:Svf1-like C-terminal lipocalin-like domain